MLRFYSPYWLVIGFMGLVASMISTFSNNVEGFTSAWVQEVYSSGSGLAPGMRTTPR
jgi:hypothetical protein